MRKFFYSMAIISLSIFLIQCTAKKVTSTKAEPNVLPFAVKRWPAITQADLDSGRVIFTTRCTRCHGLKKIKKRSEQAWLKILDRMAPRAKLNPEQKEIVTHYILAAREAGVR